MIRIDGAKKIPGAKILSYGPNGYLVLKHKFAHRDDPKLFDTLQKIRDAGSINPQHWRKPYKGEF